MSGPDELRAARDARAVLPGDVVAAGGGAAEGAGGGDVRRFNVEVVFAGLAAPPMKVPVLESSPQAALDFVKGAVREALVRGGPAGGWQYTVGVYGHPYRMNDVSLAAERVTLVTMPGEGAAA
ncbi:hypothetical protein [Streptomyces albogriseolus]|uniref:hypothetical protein n=1 Tax=Streptomyces albogriseolus TaxID=1887 RepID=UPI0034600911